MKLPALKHYKLAFVCNVGSHYCRVSVEIAMELMNFPNKPETIYRTSVKGKNLIRGKVDVHVLLLHSRSDML